MQDNNRQWLTVAEYAEIIGKAPRTVRQYCKEGILPGAVKVPSPYLSWQIPANVVGTSEQFSCGGLATPDI